MIDPLKTRILLRKTKNDFISDRKVSQILNVDKKTAIEILTYLENMGYIDSVIDGLWHHSIRGKILANKKLSRTFKRDTLKRQLDDLIKRVKIVNSSPEYPLYVNCAIVTTEYPIKTRSSGINIAYSLKFKDFSEKERDIASDQLRKRHHRGFDNLIEYLFYPNEAIRLFLKSSSPVLKLMEYDNDEIKNITGHKIKSSE